MSDAIGRRVKEYYDQRLDGLLNTTERQRINQYTKSAFPLSFPVSSGRETYKPFENLGKITRAVKTNLIADFRDGCIRIRQQPCRH